VKFTWCAAVGRLEGKGREAMETIEKGRPSNFRNASSLAAGRF
jgi:hypothetical protein